MDHATALDTIRGIHIVGLALGLGLALYADFTALRFLVTPVRRAALEELARLHALVFAGLGMLWFSGLVLLTLRTGFDPGSITPKLGAKLAVVLTLTANALAIGDWALPALRAEEGRPFAEWRRGLRLRLALVAALSAASWGAALVLGTFATTRAMDVGDLALLLGAIYGGTLALCTALALAAPALALLLAPADRGAVEPDPT